VLVVVVIPLMIMVVIIPIAVCVPTMAVLVPPLVRVRPAILSRFVQLLARVDRLSALPAMMLGGFVQPVVGLGNAPLAGRFVAANRRCAHENESGCQRHCREPRPDPKWFP
jgi:hypothetical protein